MARIDQFFHILHQLGGSDLHLSSGCTPMVRVHGTLQRLDHPTLDDAELAAMLDEIIPPARRDEFAASGDLDFGYAVPDVARYRANFYHHERGVGAAFREIPSNIPSVEALGLPPLLRDLAMLPKGLVLLTGPTGSGKSTTLAAMIDHANTHRRDHIITIEDPVEFVHAPRGCLINQREVGRHTKSFAAALRGALREDPDIILVGEMRDLETISLALEAAETGHLVLSTVHTISAPKTIDRIVEVFPPEMQAQIRTSLSETLQAVISQVLFPRADRPGRVAALEIMLGVPAVRNLIRESKTYQLASVLQTGKNAGMQTLDDDILRLLAAGLIHPRDAAVHVADKPRFKPYLTGVNATPMGRAGSAPDITDDDF